MNGMDDDGDDDNYSDDGFDDLPDTALRVLEQNAIQSTQQPRIGNVPPRLQKHDSPTGLSQGNKSARFPFQRTAGAPEGLHPHHAQLGRGEVEREQLDAGLLDDGDVATPVEEKEEYVPHRFPGELTQREQWRQDRFGQPNVLPQSHYNFIHRQQHELRNPIQEDSGYHEHNFDVEMQDSMLLDDQQATPGHADTSDQAEALRAQIQDLLRERDDLARELHTSKSTVMTQRGEIAIVRANQSKEAKVFDRQIAALKKAVQEEAARKRADIEAMDAENKKVATENQFLKQDLAEEAEKINGLRRSLKDKPRTEKADGPATTPKKSRTLPLRDGFDDGEIMAISPIKSGRKSKGGTPSAGAKRKRKVNNASPIAPLILSQSFAGPAQEAEIHPLVEKTQPVIRKDPTAEKSLRFMQRIFNHRAPTGRERVIEALTKHTFPSDEAKPLSSIILEACATFSGDSLPSDFLLLIISLWSRALKEIYYKPIILLRDVIEFVVALDSSVITSDVITRLLPVLESSGNINGVPRFKNSPVAHQIFGQFRHTPQSELNQDVNGTECLEILYHIACACLRDEGKIRLFWQSMTSDFILMMLNSSQPISDLTLTLNLLSTSILPNTFGNLMATETDQVTIEKYILDRVTYLLWETPRVDEGQQPYTKAEVSELRLEVIDLLSTLSLATTHPHDNPEHHGSLLLATHPSAIGRLIRCIYDEVDALYAHEPGHELHAEIVNDATRLVYRLLQLHGNRIDMQQKLMTINGGVHKHRVVLTRLAFSEGLFLEAGITDETVMMAHDMLEDAVTPEEAESLLEVFPAHKGRKGATQG